MNKPHHDISPLLTAKEVAARLKVSLSWLAKARMRGTEAATAQWMKSRQRLSTSE